MIHNRPWLFPHWPSRRGLAAWCCLALKRLPEVMAGILTRDLHGKRHWKKELLVIGLAFAVSVMSFAVPPGITREEWRQQILKKILEEDAVAKKKLQAQKAQREAQTNQAARESEQLKRTSPEEFALRNISQIVVLHMDPLDSVVQEGARCATDVVLTCQGQRHFNVVDLAISFDPLFVEPVSVHDPELRPLVIDEPVFETDLEAGRLRYQARLSEPVSFFRQTLITIVWQALRPVDSTQIELAWPQQRSSARLGSSDLLVHELMPEGALLPFGLSIIPKERNRSRGLLLPGRAALDGVPSFVQGDLWLELRGPTEPAAPGQEFDVEIHLQNPDQTLFDTVSLWLRYPSDRIEVLDWDRNNWIRTGVNINDAPAHELFAFDYHLANQVDQRAGEIVYRMGLTRRPSATGGILARIRARALRGGVSARDFQFAYSDQGGAAPTTDVTFLSASVLMSSAPQASSPPSAPPVFETR
jgi:hypothetical protein